MAGQATPADVLGGDAAESEDFGFVAAGVDVSFARTVAAFAALPLRAAIGLSGGKVRILSVGLRLSIVTGFAGFRSHVQRRIRRRNVGLILFRGFLPGTVAWLLGEQGKCRGKQYRRQEHSADQHDAGVLHAIPLSTARGLQANSRTRR